MPSSRDSILALNTDFGLIDFRTKHHIGFDLITGECWSILMPWRPVETGSGEERQESVRCVPS